MTLGCLNWAMMAASWRNLTLSSELAPDFRVLMATCTEFPGDGVHVPWSTVPNCPEPRFFPTLLNINLSNTWGAWAVDPHLIILICTFVYNNSSSMLGWRKFWWSGYNEVWISEDWITKGSLVLYCESRDSSDFQLLEFLVKGNFIVWRHVVSVFLHSVYVAIALSDLQNVTK